MGKEIFFSTSSSTDLLNLTFYTSGRGGRGEKYLGEIHINNKWV